jgi:hypothetical protein
MMRQVIARPEGQAELMRQGFTQAELLAPDEISFLLSELAKLRPDDNFAPQNPWFSYHCSFLDANLTYKRAASNLLRGVFAPGIKRLLVNYEILNCNFYVKPPGTGRFVIHQNWPALQDMSDTTVTVWCPLQDTDETNGTLQFVPASHKIVLDISGPACGFYFDNFLDSLMEKYLQPFPVKAGDALIFDDSLIHWSEQNNSPKPRIAVQILCVPADATPVFFYLDTADNSRFEVFAVDSEFFITQTKDDLLQRPQTASSLGFVPNPNRLLSENEFLELMRRGPETRVRLYGAA